MMSLVLNVVGKKLLTHRALPCILQNNQQNHEDSKQNSYPLKYLFLQEKIRDRLIHFHYHKYPLHNKRSYLILLHRRYSIHWFRLK